MATTIVTASSQDPQNCGQLTAAELMGMLLLVDRPTASSVLSPELPPADGLVLSAGGGGLYSWGGGKGDEGVWKAVS